MRDDMFCAAGYYGKASGICHAPVGLAQPDCEGCKCYKHKWPTPAQFKMDYGYEVPDDMSGFVLIHEWKYSSAPLIHTGRTIVIACTPYGRPPADWRQDESKR